MTALMNSVVTNNTSSFAYLFFQEGCSLNEIDINGNTILHLAAKSNSVNIAKLLRHISQDAQAIDSPYYRVLKESLAKLQPDQTDPNAHLLFFDLNRTNLAGQSPVFLTVQSKSI
jgi:ankyrin repeat protein